MNLRIRYFIHGINYSFQTLLLKREIPFIAGIVLNNECNLQCLHCNLQSTETASLSFDQIEDGLNKLYSLGIRSIALTGGEPFLWHDDKHNLNDVINLIYKKKFLVTSIYTNGTMPISTQADNVFVSIDGIETTTNKIRGPVFSTVINNIINSKHPKIFINFTINSENANEIESFCDYAGSIPQIKGLFFYFHTPYYGIDNLFQTREEKVEIAKKVISLKKKYKILNSTSALNDFIKDNWPRPSKKCIVYSDKAEMVECCRSVENKEACINCGYLGYLEVIDITKLKYSAIREGLNYMPSNASRRSYVN